MLSTLRDLAIAIGAVSGALTLTATALRLAPVRRVIGWCFAPARWAFGHLASDAGAWLRRWHDELNRDSELGRQVASIHHEVTPNDGSSIKDAVGRQEARLDRGEQRFDDLDAKLASISAQISHP